MEGALRTVKTTIDHLVAQRGHPNDLGVTLVAVSKCCQISDIVRLYSQGQRHFGENYVNELVDKAQQLKQYKDIRWHFIGHLQSNKVKQLLSVDNLYTVETVDSVKIAESLDSHLPNAKTVSPLRIFLQVNTSGEPNKHGFVREELSTAARTIAENFKNLQLVGLMTIGSVQSSNQIPNPDFQTLVDCRNELMQHLAPYGIDRLELSMGMSADYKHAIEMGSTNVRVGTLLFGGRV